MNPRLIRLCAKIEANLETFRQAAKKEPVDLQELRVVARTVRESGDSLFYIIRDMIGREINDHFREAVELASDGWYVLERDKGDENHMGVLCSKSGHRYDIRSAAKNWQVTIVPRGDSPPFLFAPEGNVFRYLRHLTEERGLGDSSTTEPASSV